MRKSTTFAVTAAMVLGLMAPAFADDAHHPPGAPGAPAPVAPAPGAPGGMAMMGGGGQGGMMVCPMMGQGAMMDMGGGMGDWASHIDGHLAFLKAELKITPAQEGEWKTFAEALRTTATTPTRMPTQGPGAAPSVGQSFEQKERVLTSRLENTKRLHVAWSKLDAVLTPDQRKAAEQILAPRLMMM